MRSGRSRSSTVVVQRGRHHRPHVWRALSRATFCAAPTVRAVRATLIVCLVACGPIPEPEQPGPKPMPATMPQGVDAGGTTQPEVDAGTTVQPTPDAGASVRDAGSSPTASGTLQVLTYNVAGLPEGLSSSKPATNTPLISPKLNAFEVVLAQEDFSYHPQLVSMATHPYVHAPKAGTSMLELGDGLAVLSRRPLGAAEHVKWAACNGVFDAKNDCLTSKGFLRTTLELAPGVLVDLYNLHCDAGRAAGDATAREKQAKQLADYIAANSAGRAVIVAGDTNMKDTDEAQLMMLLAGAGLTDACRATSCTDIYRYDRVMFRSSTSVTLSVTSWAVDLSFIDSAGAQLSDHEPVAVTLSWAAR
jgi:endonuclease/exonuclease/phosphatase family metal-dependent hydrolase